MTRHAPIVVIGGGPGGSIVATRLAQRGHRVVVLERAHHPRFHLGESLLPHSLPVLREVGVLDAVHERFIVKGGATFHDDTETGRIVRYPFADAYHPLSGHAYEVPRDEFDEILLRHAAKAGAEVREGVTVTRVGFEGARASHVEARDESGKTETIAASFIVDCSGRDAILPRARGAITRIPALDKTALFSQYENAWRDSGDREGDIQIIVFPPGWFWVIPFKDGRTSVGAVVSSAWLRAKKEGGIKSASELFAAAVAESPTARRMIEGATQTLTPEATADFSFRVSDLAGDGWIAVGDSSGFIDPLFSTGAHLAMNAGLLGADAIAASLEAGDVSRGRFAEWERFVRRGGETYIGVVQAFYAGRLTPYLFAENQHPVLRKAITSMLAGDVFDDDARWVRDLRQRFAPTLA